MLLRPGIRNSDVGNTAWSFVDENGRAGKQFFVNQIGHATITLDIIAILGDSFTDDELRQIHHEVQRQRPASEVAWRSTVRYASDVITTLFKACGMVGIMPRRPFATVQDFQAWLLDQYGTTVIARQQEQLGWVRKAVREAQAHRVRSVAACIKEVLRLGEISGVRIQNES